MKTILLTHEYPPMRGGVGTYCHETGLAAVADGRNLEVLAAGQPHPQDPRWLKRMGGGTTLAPWHIAALATSLSGKRQELEGHALVLGSYGAHLAAMVLVSAGGLQGVRLYSLLHGSEIPRFERKGWCHTGASLLFKRLKGIFVNSRYTHERLKAGPFGQMGIPVHLAPCACGTASAREITSVPSLSDEIVVLTLARIHPRKGQLDTARALTQLPEEIRKKILYRMGGTGDQAYLAQVLDHCRTHGLRAEAPGLIPDADLPATYAACDLFAMTSRSLRDSVEGFGITYLEAGWHGKPSIAYRSGGVGEAVLHEQTGLLADEGDLDGLTRHFIRLITETDTRRRMGEAAREHARSFSWNHTAQIFCETTQG